MLPPSLDKIGYRELHGLQREENLGLEAQSAADTIAPTVPTALTATTASSTQINLSWTASTDNVGVTGYHLQRCSGTGCVSFQPLSAPTGTTYSDTGLSASTVYRYQVLANDAANNSSLYSGIATATTSAAGAGPVAWWKMDEGSGTTTADASGNANSGTLLHTPTWTTGRVGTYALSFAGTSTEVGASGSGALANLFNTGLTVSAWIKPAGAGGGSGGRIVDKDNQNGGWFFAMSSATQIKLTSDQDPSGVTSLASSTSLASITLNTWQHVLATWDGHAGGVMHVYINGVLADGTSTAGSAGSPAAPEEDDTTTPLTIGGRQFDATRGFNGAIDEVRIYNRVLSSTEIQALADSTAPTAPSGLSASAPSSTQITLNWTASTDAIGVTGYRIERCTGSPCNFNQVGTSTTNSYSDSGLTASTSYTYRVRATDANTNLSVFSNTASATTTSGGGDTSAPSAPSSFTATVVSGTQINLSWTASTDNVGVTGYQLDSCAGSACNSFTPLGSPTATSFTATGLTSGTTYNFRLLAKDAAGNQSVYSTTTATTSGGGDISPPSPPTGLQTTSVSATQIGLTWTASSDNVGVTGYQVEMCSGTCSSFQPAGMPTGTTYSVTGLTPSTSYKFRVLARDAAGNLSGYSSVLNVSTPLGGICD